jgi:hypothetical protein
MESQPYIEGMAHQFTPSVARRREGPRPGSTITSVGCLRGAALINGFGSFGVGHDRDR